MILENLEKIIDFLEFGDESSEIEEIKQVVSNPKWPLAILLGWLRNQPTDGHIKPLSFSSEGSWIVELRLIVNNVGFLSDSLIFDEASLRFKDGVEYKHFRPLVEDRWHPVVHVSYARDYLRGIARGDDSVVARDE